MTQNEIKHKQPRPENAQRKYSKNMDLAHDNNLKCKECGKISGIDKITLKRDGEGYICTDCILKNSMPVLN